MLAIVLAYVLALQGLLALRATVSHVVVGPAQEVSAVICPAHADATASLPAQPIHAEHHDLCCIRCGGLASATLPISPPTSAVRYDAQAADRIRAPPGLSPPIALPRPPVQQRAPPRFV